MSAKFDPYYTWLAIPPEEQPPHHYRLLGVKPLEENLDVIENAADQRMKHLRDYQSGKHGELSQKLLNEVSAARVVLLDAEKKSAYDADLRAKLNAAKQAELRMAREERPLAMAKPLPTAAPLDAKPAAKMAAPQFFTTTSVKPRGSNGAALLVAVAGIMALVLLAGGGIAAMMFFAGDEPVAAVTPRANTTPGEEAGASDNVAPVVPPVIPPQGDGDKPAVEPPAVVDNDPPAETPTEAPTTDDPTEPIDEAPIDEQATDGGDGEEFVAVEDEPAAPAKLPVPEKESREAKRKEILAIFPVAQARTFEEKGEYAAQLIRTAGETADDPTAVFAMLNLAREQAAEAGQIKLAFEATDLLAETFDFDGQAVRLASVQQASRATLPPAAKRDIVIAGMDVIDEFSAADKFDDADALSDRMLAIARPLRDAELIKSLADQRKAFTELAASHKKAQSAFETLKTSPDDAEANLAAGRYLAFVKQDWEAGLAHLAKGSDAALAAAAKAELATPESPADQEKLADAWWAAADGQKDSAVKDSCRAQAVYWYREVVDELTGLAKVKVEKRIDEARDDAGAVASASRGPRRKPKGQLPAEITVAGRMPAAVTLVQGMPKEFEQFKAFEWEPSAQRSGMLEFSVDRAGIVYMSASFPETKYEGNSSGGWYDGRATREKLVQAGWQELGKCAWDDTRYLYVRMMEKGGPYRIQTNKYGAPDIFLPPDPLAAAAARTEPGPDLGIFSRDPRELSAPLAPATDDLWDVSQGTTVSEHSRLAHGDIRAIFGDDTPSVSGEATGSLVMTDGDPGTTHFVEWETRAPVTVRRIAAFARSDDDSTGQRKIRELKLFAWDAKASRFRSFYSIVLASPYGDTKPPRGALIETSETKNELRLEADVAPTTAQRFRAEFVQGASANGMRGGPRIFELDAFGGPRSARVANADDENSSDTEELNSGHHSEVVYLDDLAETESEVGYGSLGKHGADGARGKVRFAGEARTHSLSVHAKESGAAFVTYRLGKKYDTFQATAGLRESSGGEGGESVSPLTFSVIGDKKVLWKSRPIKQHGDGEECSVSVRGVDVLTLQVDSPGLAGQGWSVWVEPRLTLAISRPLPEGSAPVYLDDLTESDSQVGWGELGKHGLVGFDEHTRKTVRGKKPLHALSMTPPSDGASYATYELKGKYTRFQATAALWQQPGYESASITPLTFKVLGDGKVLWKSSELKEHIAVEPCDVGIQGVKTLRLEINCPGHHHDAWGVWIDPQISNSEPLEVAQDDAPQVRPPKAKKPNPKAFYNCVIGGYMNYHESKPVYPLLNLQVPDKNLWNAEYAAQLQNMVRDSLAYRGQARFYAPQDGDYDVQAANMGVTIDGVKLAGFRDAYTERVTLRKGLHSVVLDSHTHGQPYLQNASAKIIDAKSGDELLLVNLWADVQAALATPVGGQRVIEISGWQPVEEKIVPIKLK